MTTTRRVSAPTVDIYQDPHPSYPHSTTAESELEARLLSALGPASQVSLDHNTLFNPPTSTASGYSPKKSASQRSSSPLHHTLAETDYNAVAMPLPESGTFTDSIPKKKAASRKRRPTMSAASESLLQSFDQENRPPSSSANGISFEESKPNLKRSFGESLQPRDRAPKKQKVQEEEPPTELPDPKDMPPVSDPGCKPEHSYATMIGMALLRAPNRRLTLSLIYKWISQSFSYYSLEDSGWQNSIRHNLSLNKNFIKQARPKEDTGKGHYWMIVPGQEHQFLKDKSRARSSTISVPPSHDFVIPPSAPLLGPAPVLSSQAKNVDSSKFPEETDIASDDTIPCSDPALHDGQDKGLMPPPRAMNSSPPPEADIRSSPPAPPSRHSHRAHTPPRFPGSGRSGAQRRKIQGFGDSGYYSSIESSAVKTLGNAFPTSDADFNIIKPGRAEHEILRMRSSPRYHSPIKNGNHKKARSTSIMPSSSPYVPRTHARGPLTPPIKFAEPVKAPDSVSPATNLEAHRLRVKQMYGTPDCNENSLLFNGLGQTPQPDWLGGNLFNDFGDIYSTEPTFKSEFDVFADLDFPSVSPIKSADKRPGLHRAQTTTGVLADITGAKSNTRLNSSPLKAMKEFLNFPDDSKTPLLKQNKTPARFMSPAKQSASTPGLFDENAFSFAANNFDLQPTINFPASAGKGVFNLLPSDGSEEGFDMLSNFPKIGAPTVVAANGSPVKQARPSMTRSTTSRW